MWTMWEHKTCTSWLIKVPTCFALPHILKESFFVLHITTKRIRHMYLPLPSHTHKDCRIQYGSIIKLKLRWIIECTFVYKHYHQHKMEHTLHGLTKHPLYLPIPCKSVILSYKLYLCDMRVLALIYILNAHCGLLTSHVWGWLHWFGM